MVNMVKKLVVAMAILGLNANVYAATSVDSTQIKVKNFKPIVQSYLLAQGELKGGDGYGNNDVNIYTTSRRCKAPTRPRMETSVKGIQVFVGYAIKGVENNLKFNPYNYRITGQINAPTAGTWNPNYVVASWQIWCQA